MTTVALTPATPTAVAGVEHGWVDLYWIPLGAGARSVRINGMVYEWFAAAMQHRARCDLYHSALEIRLADGRFMVEMTPVPDDEGPQRGVVANGPVGIGCAGRLRVFRYEVRRWRDGIVPDLDFAVTSPIRVTNDLAVARAVYEALPNVPRLTWGRDEAGAGEMWSCNSIVSWALTMAGIDASTITAPDAGRAPGWDAGIDIAARRRGDVPDLHNLII